MKYQLGSITHQEARRYNNSLSPPGLWLLVNVGSVSFAGEFHLSSQTLTLTRAVQAGREAELKRDSSIVAKD